MKSISIIFLLPCLLFANTTHAQKECPIIPLPTTYVKNAGKLDLTKVDVLMVNSNDLSFSAKFLINEIYKHTGREIFISLKPVTGKRVISLELGSMKQSSGYTISVNSEGVKIQASNSESIFNGVSSFLQLIRLSDNNKVQNCKIEDQPGLQWRGLMLDEARHFFGKNTVKQLLDWMAFYKLNRFHWHLTDEQGWRIHINKYPKLTDIGGIGNYSDPQTRAAYYTQADTKEIVAYAKERFIEVIPEIDMPGHATAANRAYPEFSGGRSPKRGEYTFNPGKEETYGYLTAILKEVKSLFPFGMIHIGGDEVHFGNQPWATDANVQQLMTTHNLKDLKEVEKYFVRRMADSVIQMNNDVLAWDEVTDVNLPVKNTVVFWWRYNYEKRFKEALDNGYRAVLCPQVPFYMDFLQDSTHTVGRRRTRDKAFNSVERIYHFSLEEFSLAINNSNRHLVLGLQANLWTERTRSTDKLQYMLFPRMAALAETAWKNTGAKAKDYNNFKTRLADHLELYRKAGVKFYNPLQPETTPEVIDSKISNSK